MKFLRIEKSLTSAENVVLTIVNRREGATLLNVDECHSIEVRAADLVDPPDIPKSRVLVDGADVRRLEEQANDTIECVAPDDPVVQIGTLQGL